MVAVFLTWSTLGRGPTAPLLALCSLHSLNVNDSCIQCYEGTETSLNSDDLRSLTEV